MEKAADSGAGGLLEADRTSNRPCQINVGGAQVFIQLITGSYASMLQICHMVTGSVAPGQLDFELTVLSPFVVISTFSYFFSCLPPLEHSKGEMPHMEAGIFTFMAKLGSSCSLRHYTSGSLLTPALRASEDIISVVNMVVQGPARLFFISVRNSSQEHCHIEPVDVSNATVLPY
ncbi:hypothetical protein ZIOFF_040998 [Zingiber officinale]|uniref:Uncharacterized protein n=1 Tax=Zingiber officinale TaxID=94328 RepID=A0A8J5L557_ZINOF|nr:hypothetical protein ZIOFF_040998 [Zingiber officinale]